MKAIRKNKLSIIIPFYNGCSFLGDLLTSLYESYDLSSKWLTPEIIVINDSPEVSEQDIRVICNKVDSKNTLNIKLFTNPENKGVAYSRDFGIMQATADYITWIDQDDFVHQSYFPTLEQHLQSQRNIYILNGYICKNTPDQALSIFYIKPALNFKHILNGNPVLSTSFWIVNRPFLQTLNCHFYYPQMTHKGVDDWYFSLQLTKDKQNIEYISNRLVYYRFHINNFGHDLSESIDGGLELLKFLQNDQTFPQKPIQSRIQTLIFSKKFYLTNKLSIICSDPVNFIRFLIHYVYDTNRLLRLVVKVFCHIKFRS
ncbi:MAG: glycosyltransferase [Bacteroidales bacterium]|jgi:glycosyltransferase involved in cell wall biosynthesis|nr:glycosyltransferase [Bacteroidales bacterium]